MENQTLENNTQVSPGRNLRKLAVTLTVILLFASLGLGYFMFTEKYSSENYNKDITRELQKENTESEILEITSKTAANELSAEGSVVVATEEGAKNLQSSVARTSVKQEGWATAYAPIGFSIQYPYKDGGAFWGDDEHLELRFIFSPYLATADETMLQNVGRDIQELNVPGFHILVIEDAAAAANFKNWANIFLSKYKSLGYMDIKKTLPTELGSVNFGGVIGYSASIAVENIKRQPSVKYIENHIFINKGKLVYNIRYLAPASDTKFLASGDLGKEYLRKVEEISKKMIETFSFNNFQKISIVVPHPVAPTLAGEAKTRRETLLTALRKPPFFDENKIHEPPSRQCLPDGYPASASTGGSKQGLTLTQSIYFGGQKDLTELHAYDSKGSHTGVLPTIPGLGNFSFPEEFASGIRIIDLGSHFAGLSMRQPIDGKIEVRGTEYGWASFNISGDGNSCDIVGFFVPVTPYSIGTLPLTKDGDIGPFSYDIDGDKIKDFEMSLKHPLIPEKKIQIDAVIADIQVTDKQ